MTIEEIVDKTWMRLEAYLQFGQSNLVRLVGVLSWNQSTGSSTSVYNLHHIQSTTSFPVLLSSALVEHFMTNSQTLRVVPSHQCVFFNLFLHVFLAVCSCKQCLQKICSQKFSCLEFLGVERPVNDCQQQSHLLIERLPVILPFAVLRSGQEWQYVQLILAPIGLYQVVCSIMQYLF